ncbi:hypothetical protein [Exercitatus varius]|uniref:Uncharacterized protein n=1 Tax=Exercitatus varius TaxID=67857 RepID=A0AAW6Q7J3_9PAST|nr:hypothetical protein [Exercitatus varius]MDG2949293.1 hypothetical protein [Exercitatus varius]
MYYYCIQEENFLVKGIHSIPDDAIAVSDEYFQEIIDARAKRQEIYIDNGELKLTSVRPSQYHTWNGKEWDISDEKLAEIKAIKLQKFITAIDDKAASIYSIWMRFESEYRERKDAALAFQAGNYQGEVSRYITDFAQRANLDNKTATDIILQQAAGLEKLQVELANQRMRKYELKRDGLSLEEMQAIHDEIIQQMNNLAEAYQNG